MVSLGEVPGGGPGVDPGRAWSVPQARLATDRLAWSWTRVSATSFRAPGRDGFVVLAEDDGSATVVVADAEKAFYVLDARTGDTRFQRRLPDLVSAATLVARGIVVVPPED